MGVISGHQLSAFSTPVNATSPIDANTVRGNDNSIKTAYNAHDADTTIHLQSGLVASRPAASTANQTWLATDTSAVYAYLDTGSAWVEVNYLRNTGGTLTGTLTVTGATTLQSTLAVTGVVTLTNRITSATAQSFGSVFAATGYQLYADATYGAALAGFGTTSDTTLLDRGGNPRIGILSSAITVTGSLTVANNLTVTAGNAVIGASNYYEWASQSVISSPSDGVVLLQNFATTSFSRLQFGGTTSSFPSLKRSTTGIIVQLADDSGVAPLTSGVLTVTGNSTITGTLGGITTLTATTLAGTLSTAAQANVTSLGTLTALTVVGSTAVTGDTTLTGAAGAGLLTVTSTTGAAADLVTLKLARGGTAGYSIGVNLDGANTDNFNIYKSATRIVAYDAGTWTFSSRVTMSLLLNTQASATGGAGFRLPHGAAPTSPVDGDVWSTSAGLFIRINGVTKTVTLT